MARILYAGTPDVAVAPLAQLIADGHEIVAVLTRTDAPIGRKRVMTPSPVAAYAEEHGLPIIKADKITDEAHDAIAALNVDVAAVVAYGAMIPRRTLDLPEFGWVNLHFSLLPDLRGAAPVQHALIRCHDITGATAFVLDEGMDTGPVLGVMTEAVLPSDTAGDLLERLSTEGAVLLSQAITGYVSGAVVPQPQKGEPTLAPKLERNDGRVDWSASAEAVRGRIAGTTPEPGAFTHFNGASIKLERVRITTPDELEDHEKNLAPGQLSFRSRKPARVVVGTGASPVELTRVQPAGKKMMAAADWARGALSDGEGRFE